ncbi:hypothetical protein YPPY72_0740, partial [Yersinia pestis PY-72]
MGDCRVSKGSG